MRKARQFRVKNMDKFVIRKRKHEPNEKENEKEKRSRESIPSNGAKTEISEIALAGNVTENLKSETCDVKDTTPINWRQLRGENLKCDYCRLLTKTAADGLLAECERTLHYNEGQLARVKIFGKWHDIPRKQVAYGDAGLSYNFSNNTVPARPWIPFLEKVRDEITKVTGFDFNFVLINRYRDGNDHMGEHRDDEKDLVSGYPIASLSLGQPRDFIFKHADARGKGAKRRINPVKLELEHGSLLMMKHPTNIYWYHALPPRKRAANVRINMTFRKMVVKCVK